MQISRNLKKTLCALLGTIAVSTGCNGGNNTNIPYNLIAGNNNVSYKAVWSNGYIRSQTIRITKAEGGSVELTDDWPYPVDHKIDKLKIIKDGKTTEYTASDPIDSVAIQEGQKKFDEYKAKIQEEKPKEDLEFLRNF